MEGGDLSNEVPPRFFFVFEGLLGHLTLARVPVEVALRKTRQWRAAVEQWELDDEVLKRVWDLGWRFNYRMDVVTFREPKFAAALAVRLDTVSLPVSNVLRFDSPAKLAQQISYMPNVARVFTGDPNQVLTYGSRGQVVQDSRTFDPLA